MTADEDVRVLLAEIKGQINTLTEKVEGQFNQIKGSIEFGDRNNAQAIDLVKGEVARAHKRIDSQQKAIDANRRLIWSTVVAPLLVMVAGALILYALLGHS